MSVTAYLPSPATQCTAMQQPGSSLNFSFSRFSQSSTIWLEGGAPSSNGQSCRKKREEKRKWCQWPPFLGNQNKRSEKAELRGKKNVVAAARTPVELVFLHNLNLRLEGTPPPNLNLLHNKNQNKKKKKNNSLVYWGGKPRAMKKLHLFWFETLGVMMKSEVWTHQNLDSLFHHQGGIIGGLTNSHNRGDSIFFQLL